MSEIKIEKPINVAVTIEFEEPPQDEDDKDTRSAPAFLIIILVIVLIVIVFSPDESSSSNDAYEPPPVRARVDTVCECQPGITVGKPVNVVYDQVRMRRSAGYVNKNDAIDAIHYVQPGDTAQVKGGPARKDGLCWWLIEHTGIEGWTADHSREGRLLLAAGR